MLSWAQVIQRGTKSFMWPKLDITELLPHASLCTWASENGRECRGAAVPKKVSFHA